METLKDKNIINITNLKFKMETLKDKIRIIKIK